MDTVCYSLCFAAPIYIMSFGILCSSPPLQTILDPSLVGGIFGQETVNLNDPYIRIYIALPYYMIMSLRVLHKPRQHQTFLEAPFVATTL